MIIKINQVQFGYLNDNLNDELKRLLLTSAFQEYNQYKINLDEDAVDVFRDWAMEELQKKGFDKDYGLNEKGKILEELIDLFYL